MEGPARKRATQAGATEEGPAVRVQLKLRGPVGRAVWASLQAKGNWLKRSVILQRWAFIGMALEEQGWQVAVALDRAVLLPPEGVGRVVTVRASGADLASGPPGPKEAESPMDASDDTSNASEPEDGLPAETREALAGLADMFDVR